MGYVNIQHRWDHNGRADKYDDEEGTTKTRNQERMREIDETKTHEAMAGSGATPHSGSPRPRNSISSNERR